MQIKVLNNQTFLFAIAYDRPFFKVLAKICFKVCEKRFRISPSVWWLCSECRFHIQIFKHFHPFIFLVGIRLYRLAVVQVLIVFYVVYKNLIPDDNSVTLLPIFVTRLNLKWHSSSRRIVRKINFVARFV